MFFHPTLQLALQLTIRLLYQAGVLAALPQNAHQFKNTTRRRSLRSPPAALCCCLLLASSHRTSQIERII